MKLLLAFLALTQTILAAPVTNTPATWIFLNTGHDRSKMKGLSPEAVSRMQNEHVGNFGALFNQGRLFAAGPLGDNGPIRGIVVLNGNENIAECFKADPYIQNGALDINAHPWLVDIMKFGSPKVPFKIVRHTLAIVSKGQNWHPTRQPAGTDAMLRLFPELKARELSGDLALSGPFLDDGKRLGVMLFCSTNLNELKEALEKTAAVKQDLVEVELHPQYLGAGTVHNPNESEQPPKAHHPKKIFDGKTFTGWQGDTDKTWRIEKGALVGGNLAETVPHNNFLCTTREFKNFDLRLQVKLLGTGFVNGGIQFRSQRIKDPAYEMSGYQADMGEGYWGSLYDESRRNKTLAHTHLAVMQRILKVNEWNDYLIRCEDDHIRLWLNGILTADYTEDDNAIPLAGLIALQIHGGGKAEAWYRNLAIEELP